MEQDTSTRVWQMLSLVPPHLFMGLSHFHTEYPFAQSASYGAELYCSPFFSHPVVHPSSHCMCSSFTWE